MSVTLAHLGAVQNVMSVTLAHLGAVTLEPVIRSDSGI